MQNIIVDKPYTFVPPSHSAFWARLLYRFLPGYLDKSHGIKGVEVRGGERLRRSVDAGYGVMVTPNHCRPCDPMLVMSCLGPATGRPFYVMGSWHLFMQSALQTWILRHAGVFSVYREGMDREAIKFAVQVLVEAQRPLILFPEGVISRTNDQVNHLMDGTVFIARNAAKQKASQGAQGKVVVHPVAIRYFYDGDIDKLLAPALESIEKRLSWQPQTEKTLVDRIIKVGDALLKLKEIEYFGVPQTGELKERLTALIDHLLVPLEAEWLNGKRGENVVIRVKSIRTAILPDLVTGEITEAERARRWRQLADVYLAQQLFFYPPGYFTPEPTPERLLETVERFEEDLTDAVTVHRPIRAVVQVGEAIEVSPVRDRAADVDPVMAKIRQELGSMLVALRR